MEPTWLQSPQFLFELSPAPSEGDNRHVDARQSSCRTYQGTVMSKGGRDLLNPIEDALGTPLRRKPEGSLGSDLELMTQCWPGAGGKNRGR
jgi:hypothetical protein